MRFPRKSYIVRMYFITHHALRKLNNTGWTQTSNPSPTLYQRDKLAHMIAAKLKKLINTFCQVSRIVAYS